MDNSLSRTSSRDRLTKKGGTISVSWGPYGGFYFAAGHATTRLCLGWIAITYFSTDIDLILERGLNKPHERNEDI
jgi:hypothetical protein